MCDATRTRSGARPMPPILGACDICLVRYLFHRHHSELDLRDLISFEPELCAKVARVQGEPSVEDAVAFVLDLYGARYVRDQQEKLSVIMQRWAQLVPRARSVADKERLKAIPERLAWRFDAVWPEGRAQLHLMLRAVALRSGCKLEDAPLYVDGNDVLDLLDALTDGLRASYARSVDAAFAVELLERAVGDVTLPAASKALEFDWAAEVTTNGAQMSPMSSAA